MGILDQLFRRPQNTAKTAKDRLVFAIELQRNGENNQYGVLEKMKKEILNVVNKYFEIDPKDIEATISKEGDTDVLELNINLPDRPRLEGSRPTNV